jgi:hypothetical protein
VQISRIPPAASIRRLCAKKYHFGTLKRLALEKPENFAAETNQKGLDRNTISIPRKGDSAVVEEKTIVTFPSWRLPASSSMSAAGHR